MRLFIALNFDKQTKEKLVDTQKRLSEYTTKGNFTSEENLHLTLIFIGEVCESTIDVIKKTMDSIIIPAFKLQLNGIDNFKRDRGDIWWMGVDKSNDLNQIHSQLCEGLSFEGVKFDSRPYSPHLTLAREVTLNKNFDRVLFSRKTTAINLSVDKISLMKSERLGGKLTYTEIYFKDLRVTTETKSKRRQTILLKTISQKSIANKPTKEAI